MCAEGEEVKAVRMYYAHPEELVIMDLVGPTLETMYLLCYLHAGKDGCTM